MATCAADLSARTAAHGIARPLTFCHVTTAHTSLKSRSFHRECLPLAAAGVRVRYLAPVERSMSRENIDVLALPKFTGLAPKLAALPGLVVTALRQRASVYHFQDPQLLPVAFALKLLFRRRVIYDAYEDFPSMAAQKRRIPRYLQPVAARAIAGIEALAARCFDGIVTADPATLRRLARTGTSRKIVFYNFPNLNFFPPPAPCPKPFDIVYRGGLSERAGTFLLLEAIERLAAAGRLPRLLLIGYFDDGASEQAIRGRIRLLGLEPLVTLHGRIDHEHMAAALAEARIGVSPLLETPKFRLNIPVKIFEYWACGLPVVASDLPPNRPFFRSGHAGLLVQPGNAAELARSVAWLLDHPEAAVRMGGKGRELVAQRFNNAPESLKLLRFAARIAGAE